MSVTNSSDRYEARQTGAATTAVSRLSALARSTPMRHLALLVLLLGLLELSVRGLDVSALLLPPPSRIFEVLIGDLTSGRMLPHIATTLSEILGGFAIGAGSAFVIGCLCGRFETVQAYLFPYVVAIQSVPKVAIAPLIVIWLGFGVESKIMTAALTCFFPVISNTLAGLRTAPDDLSDMMLAFTAGPNQHFWKLRLPHALPYVFTGLEIGIVMAVIGAIVAEFVGAQSGLGYMILQRQFTMDIAGVFSIIVILSVIGIVLNKIVNRLRRRVVFWTAQRA